MPRVFRLSMWFLLLSAVPALLAAQEGDPAARFLIEKITVEGIQRGSARAIVAAETRLREGETYSEPALRQAIYRVKRLPFVLDAEMSLRRGSERGAYELVITVEPTRPVFFLAETSGTVFPAEWRDVFGDRFRYSSRASVGVRQFLGARGLAFANVSKGEGSEPSYQAGYTHYNLAGSGSYASAGIGWARDDDFEAESTTLDAELGFPVAADHSLRSSFSWDRQVQDFEVTTSEGEVLEIAGRSESWGAELDWIYDTTDDPVFPSQGDKVTGSVGYAARRSRSEIRRFLPASVEVSTDSALSLGLFGTRHVRLTPRQSVALGAQASLQERLDTPESPVSATRVYSAGVEGRHALSLWGFEKTERIGDLRLESSLSVGYVAASLAGPGADPSSTDATLATSLVFRNAWGILRASLAYTEEDL